MAKELPLTPPSLNPFLNLPKHPNHLNSLRLGGTPHPAVTPYLVATHHPVVTRHLGVIPPPPVTLTPPTLPPNRNVFQAPPLPLLSSAAPEVDRPTRSALRGGETTRADPSTRLPLHLISPSCLHHHPEQSAAQSAPALCRLSPDQMFPLPTHPNNCTHKQYVLIQSVWSSFVLAFGRYFLKLPICALSTHTFITQRKTNRTRFTGPELEALEFNMDAQNYKGKSFCCHCSLRILSLM